LKADPGAGRPRTVQPRDAASLVLLREGSGGLEVLMGRRTRTARFMPGYYVCPGGRATGEDRHAWIGESGRPHELEGGSVFLHLPRAALRETYEETGILIGRPDGPSAAPPRFAIEAAFGEHGIAPALDFLTYIGRAITPTSSPIRFNTRFFLADGRHAVGGLADSNELDDVAWHPADLRAPRLMSGVTRFMLARAIAVRSGDRSAPPLYRHIGGRAHIRPLTTIE
jgi:8-oxo-dGTP pyrophosphatase MutT (NUDIX family)